MNGRKIYLIDGFGGSPEENWLDATGKELAERLPVVKIHLDEPHVADVTAWDQALDQQIREPEQAFFITHSLGTITLLRYLIRHQVPDIVGSILVAGFARPQTNFPEFDAYFTNIDVTCLQGRLGRTAIISAKDDPVISECETIDLARKLAYPQISLPTGQHFRASDGITRLPIAVDLAQFYLR